jgi:hypothetical protein
MQPTLKMLLKLPSGNKLWKAGCDFVEICETDGYPIVYGEK